MEVNHLCVNAYDAGKMTWALFRTYCKMHYLNSVDIKCTKSVAATCFNLATWWLTWVIFHLHHHFQTLLPPAHVLNLLSCNSVSNTSHSQTTTDNLYTHRGFVMHDKNLCYKQTHSCWAVKHNSSSKEHRIQIHNSILL